MRCIQCGDKMPPRAAVLHHGARIAHIGTFLGASDRPDTIGEMLVEAECLDKKIIEEAKRAVMDAEQVDDCIIVRCNHNITAPITARLLDHQFRQNVLILSTWLEDGEEQTEANYYGNGETVQRINESLPGWTGGAGLMPHTPDSVKFWTQYGGDIPFSAFWGCAGEHHGKTLRFVLSQLGD